MFCALILEKTNNNNNNNNTKKFKMLPFLEYLENLKLNYNIKASV